MDGVAFARQRGALAELAHAVHEVEDLDTLLMLAARLVASGLDVEFSEILEASADGSEFCLRAGSGWRWDPRGPTRICPRDGEAGYGLALAGPVIVRDYRKDVRFFVSPVLLEHDVVSGLRVPISGPHGGSWGLLGAHTRKERAFLGLELAFMAAVADILAAAIATAELRQALHLGQQPRAAQPTRGPETVLLLEEDEALRWAASRALANAGYTVLTACDGAEALEIARTLVGRIDLVVADGRTVRMTGPEFLRHIQAIRPDVQVLSIPGSSAASPGRAAAVPAEDAVRQQPFSPSALLEKVRAALHPAERAG